MDFGRAVIDAEGADFAEHLFDDRAIGDAGAAHHLDAAIGDAHQRFRYRDLGHAAFDRAEAAAVEHAGGPVDHQFGLLQVDPVFGEHEADSFMVNQWLSKGDAAVGIIDRDLVRADAAAEPAHTVGQPRGTEADLRICETIPRRAEQLVGRHAQVIDGDGSVAAGH
ncbi:hypothetical protein D9M73_122020 [compost metagenome]